MPCTPGRLWQKKAAVLTAAFQQKSNQRPLKQRLIFIYIGAREGTRTPTKLLAST